MMSSCFQLGFPLLLDLRHPYSRRCPGSLGFTNNDDEFTYSCYVHTYVGARGLSSLAFLLLFVLSSRVLYV